jgi:hypothetical protein
MENARPGNERPNAIEAETPDEHRLVSIMSEDPIGMAKRGERVCTVIECQQLFHYVSKASTYPKYAA